MLKSERREKKRRKKKKMIVGSRGIFNLLRLKYERYNESK